MPESNERGALTEAVYYILLSVYTPLHGYGIIKNVSSLSANRVILGAGTLYGAINTLLKKAWIIPHASSSNDRKKEYEITPLGKDILDAELSRLKELITNGQSIIKGET